jgi:hypothetical protein
LTATASDNADQFEREKWEAEKELRERELALKTREQDNRDQELYLKSQEQSLSRWNTPLIVAFIAAALAGITNIIVTGYNGYIQNQSEAEKSESARILEMIRTGNLKIASQNLKFLIDTGLVMNPERVIKINEYLKANPNDGPVLPISGDHYNVESTNALSKASKELLESSLHDYTVYFDKLGFKVPSKKVPIRVADSAQMRPGWASYYDPGSETIIIDSSIVSDVDAPRREYTHFILLQDRSDLNVNNPHLYLIESDLADYFVCSFANRPQFAQNVASVLKLGTPYVRTLDNQNTFNRSMDATDAFMKGREIWGGAFWAIRSSLTAEVADKILVKAWQRLGPVEMGGDAASKFITALISAAIEGGSPEARSTITNILRQRKFPLPT